MSKVIDFFKRLPVIRKPAVFGALTGIAAVIVAIVMLLISFVPASVSMGGMESLSGMDAGVYTSYGEYSRPWDYYAIIDASAGIQQAAADTSRNVRTQSSIIIDGFTALPGVIADNVPSCRPGQATILLFIGLGMTFYFLNKLKEDDRRASFESQLLVAMGTASIAAGSAAVESDDEKKLQD